MKFNLFGKEFIFNFKNQIQSLPSLQNEREWISYIQGQTGYYVSSDDAIRIAAVIRCVDVVAKTMASLGCNLYKKTSDGWIEFEDHQLYNLLKNMPNYETTAYEFWHMYIFNLMLTTGAYAKIVRDMNGNITEIWNIPTRNISPQRNKVTGERYIDVVYNYQSHTGILGERIYESDFMYTPGLRFNNDEQSEDFILLTSQVLGLSIDLNTYAKTFFENGSNMGGFLSYPAGIKEDAFKRFKDDWAKMYSGVTKAHKWAILEGGFTATKMDSDPSKAQALDSRKFQVIEICRIMGVPPHKVFQLDGVNYNSIEQLNIEYCQETIHPMDVRICQTLFKDTLTVSQRKKMKFGFDLSSLLRGDTASRTIYYNNMRQNGVMSTNDIRRAEKMQTISYDAGGDEYLVNGNMISLKNAKDNLPKSMQNNKVVIHDAGK